MSAAMQARIPRQRLAGLNSSKKPDPYQSITTKRNAMPAPPPPKPVERRKCCDAPEVNSEDGVTLCYNCGHIFEESSIVAEVTFGETAGGAAMVEGGFIGENQRHANSMGGTMRGLGGMESREQAALRGRNAIEALGNSLQVRQTVIDQAVGWYKLAMNHNFIQGRRMRNVAAVAIYMAARRQPENTLMIMDLAEKIQTNVWALGDTYKAFLKKLGEEDPATLVGNKAVQEIEPLMLKYCRKLEFGNDAHKVANDAVRILCRMQRDWMVQGRQPAGICGACIILAARMNSFRRTTREVVYVVKVADSTINARLYEYKRTPSSILSVNQFREMGHRLKVKTLPPAIWRRAEREERQAKRKRSAEDVDGDDPEVIDRENTGDSEALPTRSSERRKNAGAATATDSTAELFVSETSKKPNKRPKETQSDASDTQEAGPSTSKSPARDNEEIDGNDEAMVDSVASALAAVEDGEAADPDFVMPKARGRPPKKREAVVVPVEDLEIEDEIEAEINDVIKDWQEVFMEFSENDDHELLKQTGFTAKELARIHTDAREVPVNLSPDVGENEFEDDPDVANCILGPEEVRRKEAIWITENEDWLREQQKKMLEAELEAAQDKPKKPKQKRRHHQMGDGSVLEGKPAASAAEAAHKMLKKRAKHFSSHINYDKLKELFPLGSAAVTPPGSGSSASPAASQAAKSPVAEPVPQVVEEEEAEEEYEEEQEMEEEEDLEHQYMDDDEEGFGGGYDDDY